MPDPRLLSTAELNNLRVVHSRSIVWARVLDHLAALEGSIPAREREAFKQGVLWCQGWTCSDPPPPRIYDEAGRRYPDPPAPEPAP